jgi:hypothetical protein
MQIRLSLRTSRRKKRSDKKSVRPVGTHAFVGFLVRLLATQYSVSVIRPG